jgi:hypothetical protein
LVRRLAEDAEQIQHMSLHYASSLPLGDVAIRNLPETLRRYAEALGCAARDRIKTRHPNDFREREIEIVRLLDRSVEGKNKHYYEESANLIQSAYNVAAAKERTVSADQLRNLYNRQTLRYRLKSLAKERS